MMFCVVHFFVLAMFLLLTNTCAVGIVHREPCAENFTPCSLPGATSSIVPAVGDALSGLYYDLVSSVNPQPVIRDVAVNQPAHQTRDTHATICCAQGTECRLLQSYNLAFCWDRFTTNFFLPDGSYGNVFTGYYSSSSGELTNLLSGDIALANGQTGNIYSDVPQAKPVTSLLPVPTPWTSKGVGTAIPDSELGAEPTYSITTARTAITPTNGPSFPSVPPTAESTGMPIILNVTGFPAYPTASMGEPYGYGPPPASVTASMSEPSGYGSPPVSNTTIVEPSTGTAQANLIGGSRTMLRLMLLACLLQIMQSSFSA